MVFSLSIGDGIFDHANDVVLRIKADQVARFGQVEFVMCRRAVYDGFLVGYVQALGQIRDGFGPCEWSRSAELNGVSGGLCFV